MQAVNPLRRYLSNERIQAYRGSASRPVRGSRRAVGRIGCGPGEDRGRDKACDRLLRPRTLRAATRRSSNILRYAEPRRFLAPVGEYAVRASTRFRGRRRRLRQDLGFVAQLDPVFGRARAAVQCAVLPELSCQGRPRPATGAGRCGRVHGAPSFGRARRQSARTGLWRPAPEPFRAGHTRRGQDDGRLGGSPGPARRR